MSRRYPSRRSSTAPKPEDVLPKNDPESDDDDDAPEEVDLGKARAASRRSSVAAEEAQRRNKANTRASRRLATKQLAAEEEEASDEDDAPEAVPLSESKSKSTKQLKSEHLAQQRNRTRRRRRVSAKDAVELDGGAGDEQAVDEATTSSKTTIVRASRSFADDLLPESLLQHMDEQPSE